MARAVCKNCRRIHYWHAGRGIKLKNISCPKCGGELEAYRWGKHHAPDNSYVEGIKVEIHS